MRLFFPTFPSLFCVVAHVLQPYKQFSFQVRYKCATLLHKTIIANSYVCWFRLLSQTCFHSVQTGRPDPWPLIGCAPVNQALTDARLASGGDVRRHRPAQTKRKYQTRTTFTIKCNPDHEYFCITRHRGEYWFRCSWRSAGRRPRAYREALARRYCSGEQQQWTCWLFSVRQHLPRLSARCACAEASRATVDMLDIVTE